MIEPLVQTYFPSPQNIYFNPIKYKFCSHINVIVYIFKQAQLYILISKMKQDDNPSEHIITRTKVIKRSQLQQSYIPPQCPKTDKKPYKLLNQYLKLHKIGEGPYSQIKLVYNMDNKKYYAMKKYNMFVMKKKVRMIRDKQTRQMKYSSYADQAKQQVDVWSIASKNPKANNIAKLSQIIEDQEQQKLYLFMQYCEKRDIAKWNSKKMKFNHNWDFVKQLLGLFQQAAQGLADLHQMNIVHRDIKPLNLMVNAKNQVKIIDFGLSVLLQNSEERLEGTYGTYYFNAPEMLEQKQQGGYNGKRTDVWALGVSFFAVTFGYLPFYHELEMKLFQLIDIGQYEIPDPLPDKDMAELVPLIKRMLSVESKGRPTAEQVCLELKNIRNKFAA